MQQSIMMRDKIGFYEFSSTTPSFNDSSANDVLLAENWDLVRTINCFDSTRQKHVAFNKKRIIITELYRQ